MKRRMSIMTEVSSDDLHKQMTALVEKLNAQLIEYVEDIDTVNNDQRTVLIGACCYTLARLMIGLQIDNSDGWAMIGNTLHSYLVMCRGEDELFELKRQMEEKNND